MEIKQGSRIIIIQPKVVELPEFIMQQHAHVQFQLYSDNLIRFRQLRADLFEGATNPGSRQPVVRLSEAIAWLVHQFDSAKALTEEQFALLNGEPTIIPVSDTASAS